MTEGNGAEPRRLAELRALLGENGAEVRRPVWIAPVGTAPDTEAWEWQQIGTASSVQFDGAPDDMYGDDVDG